MSDHRESNVYVNPDLEGYLVEKKFMKNVKTWCSLQGPTLYLQKTQGGAIQTIDMAREVQHVKPLEGHVTFEISHKNTKHIFICGSPGECASWVTALLKAMALKSNGFGQSTFASSLSTQEENPYALASDDVMEEDNTAKVGTVYEDIGNVSTFTSNDTKQTTGNSKADTSEVPPALPSMDARIAKRQLSNEIYYGDAQSIPERNKSPDQEVYYSEGVSSTSQEEVCYSEGISTATNASVYETINISQGETQSSKVEMRAGESNGSGVVAQGQVSNGSGVVAQGQGSNGSGVVAQGQGSSGSDVMAQGQGDDESGVVMRRSQAFVVPNNDPPTPDIIVEEPVEEEDPELCSAFAQLDQALTCQEYPDVDLQYPLTSSDYQPIMELQKFLANNQQLTVDSTFDHRLTLLADEDPIGDLKLYIEKLSLTAAT